MEYHSARKRTKLIIKATGMNFKKYYAKRKKPDPKEYILHDCIYVKFRTGKTHLQSDKLADCLQGSPRSWAGD